MRGVLVSNVPMSPWEWVQSQATLVWPSLYQGVILSFQLRWSFTILITEVKYVKINWKKYQIFWFLKNKCLLGTIVCCSRTGQMLGSSSEDLSIYLIMKLFTTFQFGIIFISYWFGWTHITVLYLTLSESMATAKLPDPAKAPSKHLWPVWLASCRAWEGDCGNISAVSFTVQTWCVFCKSGQEDIRITNKNKWYNGLFGELQFRGHKPPKLGTVYSTQNSDAKFKVFPLFLCYFSTCSIYFCIHSA